MKEAMGGISIFQIVIVFILIFTGIMCLTINHAKAFGVKDEIVNIIESASIRNTPTGELDDEVTTSIAAKLAEVGYRASGDCPNGANWVGYDRNGEVTSGDATFCIRINNVTESYYNDLDTKCDNSDDCVEVYKTGLPKMYYYDLALFYQLDIPLVSAINFRIYGSSKTLFG